MDINEIHRLLHKIELCLKYVIAELENNDDPENEYYIKFAEIIELTVNEILEKITNIRIDTKPYIK